MQLIDDRKAISKTDFMLDYTKTILHKVSFNKNLFHKELCKAISWLTPNDREMLYDWCKSQFGDQYPLEIDEAFGLAN